MSFYCDKDDPDKGMNPSQSTTIVPVIGRGFDYESATNKPRINGVELNGDKTNDELLISPISNEEIAAIISNTNKKA